MRIAFAVILIAVFGSICWSILAAPVDYVIRFSRGIVRFRGKFPAARQAEVIEFFRREFHEHNRITVSAVRTPGRGQRYVIRGKVSAGDVQRIRNFLRTM